MSRFRRFDGTTARKALGAGLAALILASPALGGTTRGQSQTTQAASAQTTPTPAEIASSPVATRLRALIQALNGGEAGIAAYAATNAFAPLPAGLAGPPIPSPHHQLLELHYRARGYTLLGFISASATEAKARVRNTLTGQLEDFILHVEPSPPHLIRGMGIDSGVEQPAQAFRSDDERVAAVSAYTQRLADAGLFGGVVLIARDGKPIFQQAYGYANRDKRIANGLDTRFRLASLSKMFTGFAIGRLVEQGKLSYEDPLSKFVPDFPDAASAKKVRVKHLLSHTSGITGFIPPLVHNAQKLGDTTDGLAVVKREPLEFEPGARWSYSNTGFLLLGRVIEVATGDNYFHHMEKAMLRPLGLENISFPNYEAAGPEISLPYELQFNSDGKAEFAVPDDRTRWGGPAGDAAAGAADLLRFANLLEAGKIVSPATLRLHTSPKAEIGSPDYGYAIGFDFPGRDIYGHSGGAPGTCSRLAVIRDLPAPYTVVVLGNAYGRGCGPIVSNIVSSFAPAAATAR